MNYKNGGDILPPNLLKELQKYIQGELVYIPKDKERASWGECSGTRKILQERNNEIYALYSQGKSVKVLANQFCLSEDSIKKILIKFKKSS